MFMPSTFCCSPKPQNVCVAKMAVTHTDTGPNQYSRPRLINMNPVTTFGSNSPDSPKPNYNFTSSLGVSKFDFSVKTATLTTDTNHLTVPNPQTDIGTCHHKHGDSFMSYTAIFNEIDSMTRKPRWKAVSEIDTTFNSFSCFDSVTAGLGMETDSGYDSNIRDNSTSTLSWSPRSTILRLVDNMSTTHNMEERSANKNLDYPDSQTVNMETSTSYPRSPLDTKNVTSPVANKLSPNGKIDLLPTPFTCAQRTCNNLTFGYFTPTKSSHEKANHNTGHTCTVNETIDSNMNSTPISPENISNTTLDILHLLDNDSDPDTTLDHSPPQTPMPQMTPTARQTRKPRLISKSSLDITRQTKLDLTTCNSGLDATPNKRNTKRNVQSADHSPDSNMPKPKVVKLGERPNVNHINNLVTNPDFKPQMETATHNNMDLADFIWKVTNGIHVGYTCPRTLTKPDQKYQQETTNGTNFSKSNSRCFLSKQDDPATSEIPFFLRDKTVDDRNDWFTGRREMAC